VRHKKKRALRIAVPIVVIGLVAGSVFAFFAGGSSLSGGEWKTASGVSLQVPTAGAPKLVFTAQPAAGAAIAAAALLAVSVVLSITLLVPINNRSVTWTADDHPADWREQQQRWDRLHYLRVAILIAAFVLALVAAAAG